MFSYSKSDRILVIAPHPDDESLGLGGLLQRLFAQGVPVRILFVTNGDNNPWAQRYWERRWRIGSGDRTRWGERRREEALAAIAALGGSSNSAKFINLPDLGATRLLTEGGGDLSILLAEEIRNWRPTVAFIPNRFDAHPDHSALSVAFSIALDALAISSLRVWEYLIHSPRLPILQKPVALRLTTDEVERKRQAILCHETQTALSRERFTRFAKDEEPYYPHVRAGTRTADARLTAARQREGVLHFQFNVSLRERLGSELLVLFRTGRGSYESRRLPLPFTSGWANVFDAATGGWLTRAAVVQWRGETLFVGIPVTAATELDLVYAKISGWRLFFEMTGWSQTTLTARTEEELVSAAKVKGTLAAL
jgi:LmbE family N-acetylglucosaminyl deacetylase